MSILTIAHDADDEALDICDRSFECMFPAAGSGDPMFVRYRCDRCGIVAGEAFGPAEDVHAIREQAQALFDAVADGACQAMR